MPAEAIDYDTIAAESGGEPDYDALALEAGGILDYDALAAELGGRTATSVGAALAESATPVSRDRTWGDAVQDADAALLSGVGNLVKFPADLYGLVTGDMDIALGRAGKSIVETAEEYKSPGLRTREDDRADAIKAAGKQGQWQAFKTAFGQTVTDPALLVSFLTEQAPQLLVPFGAAKVSKILTAGKSALQVGAAGTSAAVGAGAVMQGADVGAGTYEQIYHELISKGASPEDAADGAINLARASGAAATVISLLAQKLPGAKLLEETLAGVPRKAGGAIGSAVRTGLGEGISEVAEEVPGKIGSNIALAQVKPGQEWMEGTGEIGGMAAVGGAGLGGVVGLSRGPQSTETPPPTDEVPPVTPEGEVIPPEAQELAPQKLWADTPESRAAGQALNAVVAEYDAYVTAGGNDNVKLEDIVARGKAAKAEWDRARGIEPAPPEQPSLPTPDAQDAAQAIPATVEPEAAPTQPEPTVEATTPEVAADEVLTKADEGAKLAASLLDDPDVGNAAAAALDKIAAEAPEAAKVAAQEADAEVQKAEPTTPPKDEAVPTPPVPEAEGIQPPADVGTAPVVEPPAAQIADEQPAQTPTPESAGVPVEPAQAAVTAEPAEAPATQAVVAEAVAEQKVGDVYEGEFRGEKRWLVQESKKRGFGDSLWKSRAEADAHANIIRRNAEQREESLRQIEENKKKEAEAKAKRDEMDGFMDDAPPMGKAKVVEILNRQVSLNGKMTTRKEYIRQAVKDGDTITKSPSGKRRLQDKDGAFFEEAQLTKTGLDYAEHLIGQRDSTPQSPEIPKEKSAIAKRKDEVRKRIKGKAKNIGMGVDPSLMADYAELGALHVADGAVKLAEWSAKMIEDIGDAIRPHLFVLYDRIMREGKFDGMEDILATSPTKMISEEELIARFTPLRDLPADQLIERLSKKRRPSKTPISDAMREILDLNLSREKQQQMADMLGVKGVRGIAEYLASTIKTEAEVVPTEAFDQTEYEKEAKLQEDRFAKKGGGDRVVQQTLSSDAIQDLPERAGRLDSDLGGASEGLVGMERRGREPTDEDLSNFTNLDVAKDLTEAGFVSGDVLKAALDFVGSRARWGMQMVQRFGQGIAKFLNKIWEHVQSAAFPPEVRAAMAAPGARAAGLPVELPQSTEMDWKRFATENENGSFKLNLPLLSEAMKTDQAISNPVGRALLSSLIDRLNDDHPLGSVEVVDIPSSETGWQGKFSTRHGSREGSIKIAARTLSDTPVSSGQFVRILSHEILHNSVTSKLPSAPRELTSKFDRLFEFVKRKAVGTKFEGTNLLKNVEEFISDGLAKRSAREWLAKLDYKGTIETKDTQRGFYHDIIKKNTVFGRLLELTRKLLGLEDYIYDPYSRERIETISALDQLVSLADDLHVMRREAGGTLRSLSPSEQGDTTQVFGQEREIGGRTHLDTPAARQKTQDVLTEAGVGFEVIEAPDVRRNNQPTELSRITEIDDESAERLVDVLTREIQGRGTESGGNIGNLINSVRESLHAGALVGKVRLDLRRQLDDLSQEEASRRGRELAELSIDARQITSIANDPELYLTQIFSRSFNDSGEVDAVVTAIQKGVRENFGEKEQEEILSGIPGIIDAAIKSETDQGGRVYRKVQSELAPKVPLTEKQKALRAIDAEAADSIIAHLLKDKSVTKPGALKNNKLTPEERLASFVNQKNQVAIQNAIENATYEAERNAAVAAMKAEGVSAEDIAAVENGEVEPDPEFVDKGMRFPKFKHWQRIRDDFLSYSPVTVKLARDAIKARFKGTKFEEAPDKPADTRIDLTKLAVEPEAEVERVVQGQLKALEDVMADASPATKKRIIEMIEADVREQLATRRQEIIDRFLAPSQITAPTSPNERLRRLVNAGLTGDLRYKTDKTRQLIKRVASTHLDAKEIAELAGLTRAEKQAWLQAKFDEIVGKEKLDDDFFKAVVWTQLTERLGDSERALANRLMGGKDVSYETEAATPAEKSVKRSASIAKLQAGIRAGMIDQRMVGTVAQKAVVQKLTPSLKEIIKQIFDTPAIGQKELGAEFSRQLQAKLSIDPAQAEKAGVIFQRAYENKFAEARKRALKQSLLSLAPEVKDKVGVGTPLWKIIENMVNSGSPLETVNVLRVAAKDAGYREPTYEEVTKLHDLANQEQALRQLSETEKAAGLTEDEKKAKTRTQRSAIINEMQRRWASISRPISLKSALGRENLAHAANEFTSANLLARVSFLTKQLIDVGTQAFYHTPTRAISAALERRAKAIKAGNPTEFWQDASTAIGDAYKQRLASMKAALAESMEAAAGRVERSQVMGIKTGINAMERMVAQAEKLDAEGKPVQAMLVKIAALTRYSFRFASAMDHMQGTLARFQERREFIVTGLMDQGKSLKEAREQAGEIMGDMQAEYALAQPLVEDVPENQRKASAWNIVEARQDARMKAAKLNADEFEALAEVLANTIGWNLPIEGGLGKIPKVMLETATEVLAKAGFPLPIARFGNAIATGINRALTFSGGGLFPNLFKNDPWYATAKDRYQRKIEAATGLGMMGTFLGLAAAGLIRVFNRWPDDPEERELWERDGHRPNTVEFNLGDGKFIRVSMNTGPLGVVRPILAGIGAVQDKLSAHEKAAKLAGVKAKKKGLVASVSQLSVEDMMAAALQAGWGAVMQGRTTSGLLGSAQDYGDLNVKKLAGSLVSPLIPFQPMGRETAVLAGVNVDARKADMIDFLVPGPWSKQRVNFLGDPVGPDSHAQRVVSILTGGTVPMSIAPREADTKPYAILRRTGYRPPSLSPSTAYQIGGRMLALTPEKLERYSTRRASYLKQELARLPMSASKEDAQKAYQVANKRALSSVGVTVR